MHPHSNMLPIAINEPNSHDVLPMIEFHNRRSDDMPFETQKLVSTLAFQVQAYRTQCPNPFVRMPLDQLAELCWLLLEHDTYAAVDFFCFVTMIMAPPTPLVVHVLAAKHLLHQQQQQQHSLPVSVATNCVRAVLYAAHTTAHVSLSKTYGNNMLMDVERRQTLDMLNEMYATFSDAKWYNLARGVHIHRSSHVDSASGRFMQEISIAPEERDDANVMSVEQDQTLVAQTQAATVSQLSPDVPATIDVMACSSSDFIQLMPRMYCVAAQLFLRDRLVLANNDHSADTQRSHAVHYVIDQLIDRASVLGWSQIDATMMYGDLVATNPPDLFASVCAAADVWPLKSEDEKLMRFGALTSGEYDTFLSMSLLGNMHAVHMMYCIRETHELFEQMGSTTMTAITHPTSLLSPSACLDEHDKVNAMWMTDFQSAALDRAHASFAHACAALSMLLTKGTPLPAGLQCQLESMQSKLYHAGKHQHQSTLSSSSSATMQSASDDDAELSDYAVSVIMHPGYTRYLLDSTVFEYAALLCSFWEVWLGRSWTASLLSEAPLDALHDLARRQRLTNAAKRLRS